jgi:hypothetical protein
MTPVAYLACHGIQSGGAGLVGVLAPLQRAPDKRRAGAALAQVPYTACRIERARVKCSRGSNLTNNGMQCGNGCIRSIYFEVLPSSV